MQFMGYTLILTSRRGFATWMHCGEVAYNWQWFYTEARCTSTLRDMLADMHGKGATSESVVALSLMVEVYCKFRQRRTCLDTSGVLLEHGEMPTQQ